ncbi:MAG: riboflavin synthase [Saprospiraceae bacterium]|nr:riboflavin synthase [Saprospiraceae bacterium]
MFTGIIESTGTITAIEKEGTNLHFTLASELSDQLKIDQSLSHDGVCLTVVKTEPGKHTVTAILETLEKTNLGSWQNGKKVNLERAMQAGGRLDGHIVQGHVDTKGTVTEVRSVDGSWYFTFNFSEEFSHLLVPKGSVTINGVSLTVVNPGKDHFSVAIIPYTYEHTNFHQFKVGDTVNLEFDIIGKYLANMALPYLQKEN